MPVALPAITQEEIQANFAFREARKLELQTLAEILYREEIVSDSSFIYNSAGSFSGEDKLSRQWRFEMSELEFVTIYANDTQLQDINPSSVKELSILLTIDSVAKCVTAGDLSDPFTYLQMDLEIRGKATGAGQAHVFCAWRLDKQPHGQTGHFVHPLYHIQYGGRKVWQQCQTEEDYGRQLLLTSPRLAHPPLDPILAVDFILSNFFADKWAKLRCDAGDYIDLVREAQKRYWRPYAIAMASNWQNNLGFADTDFWSPQLLFPQLQPIE
jgi:hypothetical protein